MLRKQLRSLLRLTALGFYTVLLMCFGLFIFLLPTEQKRRANTMLQQFWSRILCLLFGIRVRTEGYPLPRQNGIIVVANHMSYFDIIIVGSILQGVYISKAEVRWWPVVGLAGAMVGTLYFKRESKEDRHSLKQQMIERLSWCQNIIIFPEGTTNDGRHLKEFRYGAFDVARKANTSILPVTVNYDKPHVIEWKNMNFLRHMFRVGMEDSIDVRVHVGPLMNASTYKSAADMSVEAWEKIHSTMIRFGMRAAAYIATINWRDFKLSKSPSDKELESFMTRLTSLLIQVDSSTSAGERQMCQILCNVLEVNGYNSKIHISPGGRSNLMATRGKTPVTAIDPQRSSIVLLSNSDVIPTESAEWQHPPYSGNIEGGHIWGRGALDMKGLIAVFTAAFLTASKDQQIHFLCTAHQEHGGHEGAKFMADSFANALNARVLLGEGGFGFRNILGSEKPIFIVDTAEKGALWLNLSVATDTSAHSSTPPEDYSLRILMNAIQKALTMKSDTVVLPVTERFLKAVASSNKSLGERLRQIIPIGSNTPKLSQPILDNPYLHAMFKNTIAVSQISSGSAENVLAPEAHATLDCRLLPDVDAEAFADDLCRVIDDPRVTVDIMQYSPANQSNFTDDNFRRLRQAIEEENPDATITPFLFPASTDLKFFRAKDIPCFGIFPGLFSQDDLNRIHGINEKISIENLTQAYRVVNNFMARYLD